jgi:hypothetical protein
MSLICLNLNNKYTMNNITIQAFKDELIKSAYLMNPAPKAALTEVDQIVRLARARKAVQKRLAEIKLKETAGRDALLPARSPGPPLIF